MTTRGGEGQGGEGQDLVGTTLAGRYEVVRMLGRGGMGAVYEAVQQPLGRKVALKVIRRALSDEPMAVKRFWQEAQAVAQLSHPNIVTLFDFGQTDDGPAGPGQLFLAMELLEGKSLQRTLSDEGPMPWERSLSVVTEVCRALALAHEKGIIHRDLKPDNVMLLAGRDERVKVVDFGVAKLLEPGEGQSTLTGTGMVVGTPGYISPEQVNGTSDDPRSDLYALGVMWFEMLTGRAPFEGETPMKVVLRHLHDPAPRPSALATSSLPRDIDSLVQRLLGKQPAGRAPGAAALLEELLALHARGKELAEEVVTASLSTEEVRAVVERAQQPGSSTSLPPPSETSLPPTTQSSLPPPAITSLPPPAVVTPPTGNVIVAAAATPTLPAAAKKQRGFGFWLFGCFALPLSLAIVGAAVVAVVAILRGPELMNDMPGVPGAPGGAGGMKVNGVPVDEAVLKEAVGKQLGHFVETAVSGRGDAGVADVAMEGALEVALESFAGIPDPAARQRAIEDFVAEIDDELVDPDLSPSRRRLLKRIRDKGKRLAQRLAAAFASEEDVETPAVKPDEGKPDEAKPDEAKPDEAKPDEAKPDEAKPDDERVKRKPAEIAKERAKERIKQRRQRREKWREAKRDD